MKTIKTQTLLIILFSQIIAGGDLPKDWATYWMESGKSVISESANQWILGTGALVALAATQVDLNVKNYAQTNGLLSAPVSHFGDEYGGTWGHWVLWSSIVASSKINNDSNNDLISKMQFSTLAMVTNGVITVGMKRAFGRERPNGSCCESFPSGHTSHSFTIAAITHELYGNGVGAFAYGLAVLVAVSRINDNKHYLSDVIFGATLGSAVGRAFAMNYQDGNNYKMDIGITPQMQLRFAFPL